MELDQERNAIADEGVGGLVKRLFETTERLIKDHLALARLELGEDARGLGKNVVRISAFIPLVVVGLTLTLSAVAIFVADAIGLGGGFLLVGGVTLAIGVIGTMAAQKKWRKQYVLDDSKDELSTTAQVIGAAGKPEKLEQIHEPH